jgi:Mg2+ and Co2+ transporter CorA
MNTTKESKEDKEERERLELEKDRRLLFGSSTPIKAPLTSRGTAYDNEDTLTKFRKEKEDESLSSPRNMAIIPMSFGQEKTHLRSESPETPIPGAL